MAVRGGAVAALARWAIGQTSKRRGVGSKGATVESGRSWPGSPRGLVFLVLSSVLLLGGGRLWLRSLRGRRLVDRLAAPDVSPDEVRRAVDGGRAALMDLFRLLATATDPSVREAAGQALALLWAQDQLIPEEEKAVVGRGYTVDWHTRRRFPAALKNPIPIVVSFGVPFLAEGNGGVSPTRLQWSHRITGTDRVALETYSPWRAGPGRAEFDLEPTDFRTNGPHKLALQARVRTVGLTDNWQLDLPHVPFSFEFDPILAVDALLALADEGRAEGMAQSIRLALPEFRQTEPPTGKSPASVDPDFDPIHNADAPPSKVVDASPRFLNLDAEWAMREPPVLAVTTPLPCDLAHRVEVEFEGVAGRFSAGVVLVSGQGMRRDAPSTIREIPLDRIDGLPAGSIDHPGGRNLRAILTADPDLGWSDPDIRSIWPGTIETPWFEIRIVRR